MTSEPNQDNQLLLEAFRTFNEASEQLEKSYASLQEHTKKLDLELKETNEKLREALLEEERVTLHQRGVLNSLKTGILVVDLEGTILETNPSAAKLLGFEPQRIHYKKAGLPEPVREFMFNCLEMDMPRVPRTEVSFQKDGETLDLELRFTLVRPEGGGIMSVLFIINDMTLINRLQSQATRNARLAAMGEMAAELAHEIRNPLGSIKLFSNLLEGDLQDRPDSQNLANHISQGVLILENIVGNILTFSANVTPKRSLIAVDRLLEESLPLFEHEIRNKSIQIEIKQPKRSPKVMVDSHLLKQVILNLCVNAVKAMSSNGKLKLNVKAGEEYVDLSISDSGHGIPESDLPKIFDPFYSTFQGGTGLGLSVVNQIIEKHGGAIDVKSKVGKGTTFIVSLPKAASGES